MGLHSWSLFLFGAVLFAAWAGLVLSDEGLDTSSAILISADELEEVDTASTKVMNSHHMTGICGRSAQEHCLECCS